MRSTMLKVISITGLEAKMDDRIKEWARQQIIEQTKGYVYCDLMLKPEEVVALKFL